MNYMEKLANIAKDNGGIIETKVAAKHGISRAMLYKLNKEEKLYNVFKGVDCKIKLDT